MGVGGARGCCLRTVEAVASRQRHSSGPGLPTHRPSALHRGREEGNRRSGLVMGGLREMEGDGRWKETSAGGQYQ